MSVRRLVIDDVGLIASIDRSEHVDTEYCVTRGALEQRPVTTADIPPWDVAGDGPHSITDKTEFCAALVREGAVLLGAFDRDRLMGLAVVDPSFEPGMAWLAFLHVSRPSRRQGAATALWNEAARLGRDSGAQTMYVSATPTGSAVGFYLRQGCQLTDTPHRLLYEREPDDIHLVCSLV